MKKLYLLLPILFLIYWGCEETTEGETTIREGLKLNEELQNLYNELGVTTEPQNTAVLFPTISVDAFSKHCIWDYYTIPPLNSPHDCYTIKMANVDFTKLVSLLY